VISQCLALGNDSIQKKQRHRDQSADRYYCASKDGYVKDMFDEHYLFLGYWVQPWELLRSY